MTRTRTLRWWLLAAIVFAGYLLLGVFTLRPEWFGVGLELRRVVWLSSGLGLAAILRMGLGIWPAIALAELVVTLITGDGILHALGAATGNTVEIVLAWALLRSAGMNPDMRRWSDVAALVVLAAGVACLVSAALSTASLMAFEGLPASAFVRVWVLWWLTHANGMILGAPFLLAVGRRRRWPMARMVEAGALVASLLLLGGLVFASDSPADLGRRLLYAPFPLLLWAAFRFGLLGASAASLLLSAVAMLGTAADLGPFASGTTNEALFQLWVFVAVNAVTALLVAGMVEERRHTARALARSEGHLRSVLESTADALLAVDAERKVSFANARFAELWDPDDGEPPRGELDPSDPWVARLLGPPESEDTSLARAPLTEMLSSHRTRVDEVELPDGRTLERQTAPLVRGGHLTGRIWSFRDLTERHRAEEERQRLEQQVQHAQKLESLGVLAGGIAHDFNNLLVAIMGNADLAEGALERGHPAREPVEEVLRVSQRAADLCQQMLAYAGKGRASAGPVDLNDVVQEMSELMGVSIAKNARLTLDLAADLPVVQGDVVQLRQVVLNLLTNASDALVGGEGFIRMSTYPADARDFDKAASVLDERPGSERLVALEVSDDGCGMDEATRARIFDPFFSTKAQGRGLGLAAVLGIVRGHRGTLELWSDPALGTRVRILFEARDRVGPAFDEPVSLPLPPDAGVLTGTVLVVDDEEPVRTVAARLLRQAGMTVLEAADGREALERHQEAEGAVDVVLMDLTMPRMGGVDAARELRVRQPGLPILLSTGYSDQAASAAGAGGFPILRKPYGRDLLLARIREVME